MSAVDNVAMSSSSTRATGRMPITSTKELRPRVVEILANTANGCLTELGCSPGMIQRLQHAEDTARHWQQENVKLFADNRKLSAAYNSTIAALKAQGKDGLFVVQQEKQHLHVELQRALSEIAALVNEKNAMQQRIDLLMSGKEMQNLLLQHENLRAMFARIWEENRRLKEQIHTQRQAPAQPVSHQLSGSSDVAFHPQHHRRSSGGRESASNQQLNPLRQFIQHAQPSVPSHNNNHYPRPSSTASPTGRPSSSASTSSNMQQALTINTRVLSTSSHPPYTPITPSQGAMYLSQPPPMRPTSNGLPQQPQHPYYQQQQQPQPSYQQQQQLQHTPTSLTGWPRHPPPLAIQNTYPQTQTAPVPHNVPVLRRSSWPHSGSQQNSSSLQYAMSPPTSAPPATPQSATQLSPLPEFTRRPVSVCDVTNSRNSVDPPPPPPSVVSSRRTPSTCSPEQVHEALTPVTPPIPIGDAIKGSLLLKRSSMDMTGPEEVNLLGEISRKRPRTEAPPEAKLLESPAEKVTTDMDQTAAEDWSTVHSESGAVKQETSADAGVWINAEDRVVTNADAASESVEVKASDVRLSEGATLDSNWHAERSLEDRLEDLLYQDDDGVLTTCFLCMRRYSKNLLPEQPKPFVNASLEELVAHFTSAHPTAWERTRTSPQ